MFYPQCPKCEYEGSEDYSLIDPAIIRCPQCDHVYSSIWCETCGFGGDFIENIFDRPTTWICTDCGTTQLLPGDIYKVLDGVEPRQVEDTPDDTSIYTELYKIERDAEKNNPYRWPVLFKFGIVIIIFLVLVSFFENKQVPLTGLLLATAAPFGYFVFMGYKTGLLPMKTGELIIKSREPVAFYLCYSLALMAFLIFTALALVFLYG